MGYAYNQEYFNEFVSPHFDIAMYSMLAVGVILDLACWKYRNLAMGLFPYECFMLILTNCMPINYGVYSAFVTFSCLLAIVITLGYHTGVSIVISTLLYFLI